MEAATAPAAAKIDSAKDRLQAAAEPAPVRNKAGATYHVFRQAAEDSHWEHLTAAGEVKATSRKGAIKEATKHLEDKAGTFLVIAAKELQILTRKVETRVEDIFE